MIVVFFYFLKMEEVFIMLQDAEEQYVWAKLAWKFYNILFSYLLILWLLYFYEKDFSLNLWDNMSYNYIWFSWWYAKLYLENYQQNQAGNFFLCAFSICKPSVNLLTADSPTNQKLPMNIFSIDSVQHDPVRKIITNRLLV